MNIIFILLMTVFHCRAQKCLPRNYGNDGTVCVCNSNHCDTIAKPTVVKTPQLYIYTSNKAGLRFEKESGKFKSSNGHKNQIRIDRNKKYQKILGWGGAFTDATGININSLKRNLQDKLLRSYFSKEGIEYSSCRVPIGGTDFSTHGYSYDDGDPDPELTHFSLASEDYKYKIPFIKTAFNLTGNSLRLFASAWTAPKWMKTNREYAGGFLEAGMYQPWADYHVKFLDAYHKEGITFWGITTGNEPNTGFVPDLNKVNIVAWTPCNLGRWISDNFGPTIRKSNHSNIKIMAYDDQRSLLPFYLIYTFANNTASTYVDGIAVHWYKDRMSPASLLNDTHTQFPEKFILYTEACNGFQPWERKVVLGSWQRGEKYSLDIIEDLHNWAGGWTDWNMVLDLQGGPTYIDNFVDSPIIVNATAGEFYKQPMFYHLGHFSKFIPRESVRIGSSTNVDDLRVVAFEKAEGGTVVVILNTKDKVVPVSLTDRYRGTVHLRLSERSITTVLYW